MSDDESGKSGGRGLGLGTILLCVFIVLKLVGVEPIASWSWMAVICIPILIGISLWLIPVLLVIVFGGAVLSAGALGVFIVELLGRRHMRKLDDAADLEEKAEAEAEAEAAKREERSP